MFSWIDWPVLARQAALVIVPLLIAQLKIPPAIADAVSAPLVEIIATVLVAGGAGLVGWVVWLGQRREQPEIKIAEAEALLKKRP